MKKLTDYNFIQLHAFANEYPKRYEQLEVFMADCQLESEQFGNSEDFILSVSLPKENTKEEVCAIFSVTDNINDKKFINLLETRWF